jgi:hypothetical protein
MSRKLAVVLFVMAVLVGAMGLKTVVTAHGNGAFMTAAGVSPQPVPPPNRNGASPVPYPLPSAGPSSAN